MKEQVLSSFRLLVRGLANRSKRLFTRPKRVVESGYNQPRQSRISNIKSSFTPKVRFFKKHIKVIAVTFVILVLVVGLSRLLPKDTQSGSEKVSIKPAKSVMDINASFDFPLFDGNGEEAGTIEYEIARAELLDEIVVDGKRATSIKGRIFLIISMKIRNTFDKSIEINTKDYIRLSVNGNKEEWLAPDIHNDPVEVQAISTKNTRLGFPMNESDTDLVLRIGEIGGRKARIAT